MKIDKPTETFENSNHDHSSSANGGAINIDSSLPSQTGNGGKSLTTNGTNASWGDIGDILGVQVFS